MILVNISKTWPAVLAGKADAADVTLGAWAQIKDADLEAHADAVLGVYRNVVVTAFDVDGWSRREDGRVTFAARPSETWAHLVGMPVPGEPWLQGQARPVKVLSTATIAEGDAAVEETPEGRRAVVGGYVLTVPAPGSALLQVPAGGTVTVSQIPV